MVISNNYEIFWREFIVWLRVQFAVNEVLENGIIDGATLLIEVFKFPIISVCLTVEAVINLIIVNFVVVYGSLQTCLSDLIVHLKNFNFIDLYCLRAIAWSELRNVLGNNTIIFLL
jgi:hypothetical protein